MMKKTHYKRILGLFILVFVVLFGNILSVSASDKGCGACKKDKKEPTTAQKKVGEEVAAPGYLKGRYGISMDTNSSGQYVITMKENPNIDNLANKNIKFKIIRLNTYDLGVNDKDEENPVNAGEHSISDEKEIEKLIKSKNKRLKPGEDLVIEKSGVLADGKIGFNAVLEPEFEDPYFEDNCICTRATKIEVFVETYGSPSTKKINKDPLSSYSATGSSDVDCTDWTKEKHSSFKYKFCYAKSKALEQEDSNSDIYDKLKHVYDFGNINTSTTHLAFGNAVDDGKINLGEFKCDYKTYFNSQTVEALNDESEYDNEDHKYYKKQNRKFFYGKGEYEFVAGNYVYNYESGTVTEAAKCTIACEEVIAVEYGPPVASTSGICFEYKVRVTSRVACGQKEGSGMNAPAVGEYCTPNPKCVHSSGTIYQQGGPNDAFDSCINKCDKGKYTDKCVTKCYKSVYGKSKNKVTKQANAFQNRVALVEALKGKNNVVDSIEENQLIDEIKPDRTIDTSTKISAPKYDYKDGAIIWDTGLNSFHRDVEGKGVDQATGGACTKNPCVIKETDPIWHLNNTWGTSYWKKYSEYHDVGIPKTSSCEDTCTWNGCKEKNVYLNEKQAELDYEYNKVIYDDLEATCKAAASCSSTTAEFTMSASYKMSEKSPKTTIYFPYTANNDSTTRDKLYSKHDGLSFTDTADDENSTILNYAGCYKDEGEKNWYQTEWTFPGTWQNLKGGTLSYKPQNLSSWQKFNKQFCVPETALSANTKWWIAYYSEIYGHKEGYAANDKDYYDKTEECTGNCKVDSANSSGSSSNSKSKSSCDYSQYKMSEVTKDDIDYNVHASTDKFGYFGWAFKIDCFYATNDEFNCAAPKETNKDSTKRDAIPGCKDCDKKEDYRIRPVDLTNLFPATDGSKLTSPATTGRSPGFNWSKYATQTAKNEAYKSLPSEYTKWVQAKGYSVYSDDYLDYDILLTKDGINKIKKAVSTDGFEYDNFDNGDVAIDSVVNYKSNLIRKADDYGIKVYSYPSAADALKCNNIGAHSKTPNYSASCEDFK